MISERIKALIRYFNHWWEDKDIELPEYKRSVYSEIRRYIDKKQIIAIVGLRRVGKTTIMKQLIKELINYGKENVFYFLFDDVVVQNPDMLEDILNYYLHSLAKEGRKYIFLDEIQKVPYWQDIVKRFYDTKDDVKFIVSGSSSLQIKKSKESLAGRIFDFFTPILTFREFLEMSGLTIGKAHIDFESLRNLYESNIHKKPVFEEQLLKYIFSGAFPEMVAEKDEDAAKRYINSSVTEKIVLEDIPMVFKAERKDVLFSILEYCSKETSNLLDITNLAKTLNVNYSTVKSYLFYLKNSFVLDIVYNYSKSLAKQLRKNKKVHIAHPSITISMMNYSKDILNVSEVMGKFIETTVFQHIKSQNERVSFWRTPQKEEVDIVVEKEGKLLPVEVKYKSSIDNNDAKSILKFMDRFKVKTGVMVTKDLFDKKVVDGKELLFIPAWMFLLSEF